MSVFRTVWRSVKKAVSFNFDGVMPPSERYLFNFKTEEDLNKWLLYSDSEYGGLSSAALELRDGHSQAGGEREREISRGTGVFSGNLSMDLEGTSKWGMKRSGFCGMRSRMVMGYIDLDSYDTISMRLRGDGRHYISTVSYSCSVPFPSVLFSSLSQIYTENWVNSPAQPEDNTWQAFILPPRDEWSVSHVPLRRYVPTWHGGIIRADLEMNQSRVVAMSLAVNASSPSPISGPGPFSLQIDWIKATRSF